MPKTPHIETVRNRKIQEDVAYVKEKTQEIEDRIVATTEELFKTVNERELLHISIRVSCDFHKFLLDFGDEPPTDESQFVADTIRSGLKWFYLLAFHCQGVRDDLVKWNFDREATSTYSALRAACLKRFEVLCDQSAGAGDLLAALLEFIHLELVFMAQSFPSVVDSNLKADQWKI